MKKVCVLLLIFISSVFAYPFMSPIDNRVYTEGDTIEFEVNAHSWQLNRLTFSVLDSPPGYLMYDIGHIGGCSCSETIWGAIYTFYTDLDDAGVYELVFYCSDTLGVSDFDTMTLTILNFGISPEFDTIPDTLMYEYDSLIIDLTDYIHDPDNTLDELEISFERETHVTTTYSYPYMKITNDTGFIGVDTIKIVAMDPDSMMCAASFILEVLNLEENPVISELPDTAFYPCDSLVLMLDDFISDPDISDEPSVMTWTSYGHVGLVVDISETRVASIRSIEDFEGIDTVFFIAVDPSGLADTAYSVIEILHVNIPPVLSDIADTSVIAGNEIAFNIADYFTDPDHDIEDITFDYYGNTLCDIMISIENIVSVFAHTEISGIDSIYFTATDLELASDTALFILTVDPDTNSISERIKANDCELMSVFPNPFNSSLSINLKEQSSIEIYTFDGRLIDNYASEATGEFIWNAENCESGIYYIKVSSNGYVDEKRVILLK